MYMFGSHLYFLELSIVFRLLKRDLTINSYVSLWILELILG